MTVFSNAVEIAAPPERVWTVLADLERWPEWTQSVTSIELLQPGPLAVGTTVRVSQPKLKPAVWEVTEVKTGRSFTWVTRQPGFLVTGLH
ncbi:MAG TPA: SRPBCC family protein, partial [Gemmatimonadales bacterium]|nr:SRPBCC family protein [Gemmatimonadales bacterium]